MKWNMLLKRGISFACSIKIKLKSMEVLYIIFFFLHFLGKLGKGNVSYPKVQSMLLSWLLLSTYSETCIKRTSSGNAVVST